MNSFKFRSYSLTKTWPGGRRKALLEGPNTPVWNNRIASFTRPYTPIESEPLPLLASSTGMASIDPTGIE